LLKADGNGELSSQFAGRPFVGQADGLWQLLLQMAEQPKSAPAARFASELAASKLLAHNPIVTYYSGVIAMRKGDKATALPIWRQLEDAGQLTTPWFKENTALLTRERASALAEAQQWQDVVALQPKDLATVSDSVLAEVLAAAHFQLGYAASEANQWAQAVQHWEQANRLVKVRSVAQNLALALERLGRWNDAASAWREMVRRSSAQKRSA
jgi:tetratricopeptide (TPR) repeat protein